MQISKNQPDPKRSAEEAVLRCVHCSFSIMLAACTQERRWKLAVQNTITEFDQWGFRRQRHYLRSLLGKPAMMGELRIVYR